MKKLLISTEELAERLCEPDWVIVDVRWDASRPDAAYESFWHGHLPGAVYLDLDRDLSDRSDLSKGRHPLPDPRTFAAALNRVGIGTDTQLVVYDDKLGSVSARLWWMMRWIGAPEAMMLDGGLTKWLGEGRPIEQGEGRKTKPSTTPIIPILHPKLIADVRDVESARETQTLLLDARAPERYRGDVEPIDVRAGHIPGAINVPWTENLTDTEPKVYRYPEELRSQFHQHNVSENASVICYCGSGVTACHNLVALELAGYHGARLYPGSWSGWIAQHSEASR